MYLKAPLSYFTVSRLPCEPSKTRQYQCACVLGTLTFLMRKTDVFSEAVLSADVTHLVDLGCEISLVGFIHCGLKLAQAASLERTMTDTNNKPFFFYQQQHVRPQTNTRWQQTAAKPTFVSWSRWTEDRSAVQTKS